MKAVAFLVVILALFCGAIQCQEAPCTVPECNEPAYEFLPTHFDPNHPTVAKLLRDMDSPVGKTFVISGTSTKDGQGNEAAQYLQSLGARVIGVARNDTYPGTFTGLTFRGDLSEEKDMDEFIDFLRCNNVTRVHRYLAVAGELSFTFVQDTNAKLIRRLMDTNLIGNYQLFDKLIAAGLMGFNNSDPDLVVWVTSISAELPIPIAYAYGVTKGAIVNLIESFNTHAVDMGWSIRMIGVAPDTVQTKIRCHVVQPTYGPCEAGEMCKQFSDGIEILCNESAPIDYSPTAATTPEDMGRYLHLLSLSKNVKTPLWGVRGTKRADKCGGSSDKWVAMKRSCNNYLFAQLAKEYAEPVLPFKCATIPQPLEPLPKKCEAKCPKKCKGKKCPKEH